MFQFLPSVYCPLSRIANVNIISVVFYYSREVGIQYRLILYVVHCVGVEKEADLVPVFAVSLLSTITYSKC